MLEREEEKGDDDDLSHLGLLEDWRAEHTAEFHGRPRYSAWSPAHPSRQATDERHNE